MRLVVTSVGPDATSQVDTRFGRAQWLQVVDTETGETVALDNTANADARSGAGVTTAQRVVDAKAEVVLTGRVGPNAHRVLDSAGVRIVEDASGTVEEAIAAFTDAEEATN